jgi:hypothetical protein
MVSKSKAGQDKNGIPADEAAQADAPEKETPPAASPLTTLILTDIALSAGRALLVRSAAGKGVAGRMFGRALPARGAGGLIKAPSLTGSLVGTAIARVATRSVPGAIVVGGGLVAKALYDRRKARHARAAAKASAKRLPPKG